MPYLHSMPQAFLLIGENDTNLVKPCQGKRSTSRRQSLSRSHLNSNLELHERLY